MFDADRTSMRRAFVESWRKMRSGLATEPLERLIAETVAEHPEYHALLESPESLSQDFTPAAGRTNPFLHMAMHLTLREQISTNRPDGIAAAYRRMLRCSGTPHEVEHKLMECLGDALWAAQRHHRPPDQEAYLECIERLAERRR